MPPEFAQDPERLRRFEHEARAAAALNHPNILVLYDIGTQDGALFIVTKLLEGEALRRKVEAGPLPGTTAAGHPVAHLVASTSGTDSDWVVKLIDVYPDQVAARPEMGGYQLIISADIFRGRYRESFKKAAPLASNEPLL